MWCPSKAARTKSSRRDENEQQRQPTRAPFRDDHATDRSRKREVIARSYRLILSGCQQFHRRHVGDIVAYLNSRGPQKFFLGGGFPKTRWTLSSCRACYLESYSFAPV